MPQNSYQLRSIENLTSSLSLSHLHIHKVTTYALFRVLTVMSAVLSLRCLSLCVIDIYNNVTSSRSVLPHSLIW